MKAEIGKFNIKVLVCQQTPWLVFDHATDVSDIGQVLIYIRKLDKSYEVYEEFFKREMKMLLIKRTFDGNLKL